MDEKREKGGTRERKSDGEQQVPGMDVFLAKESLSWLEEPTSKSGLQADKRTLIAVTPSETTAVPRAAAAAALSGPELTCRRGDKDDCSVNVENTKGNRKMGLTCVTDTMPDSFRADCSFDRVLRALPSASEHRIGQDQRSYV